MFNWLKPQANSNSKGSEPAASTGAVAGKRVDDGNLKAMKSQLAKISNSQNRDYEAEAKAKSKPLPEPMDKQKMCYNYNKANEFPNLYKGWIKGDGDQIGQQMIAATKAAIAKKTQYIEVLFDPVPNLDEVAFGTAWNKRFRQDVKDSLQVPEYVTNRGGPSTLEWSNIYWANRLASGIAGSGGEVVILSLSGEGTKGQHLPALAAGVSLIRLSDAKSPAFEKRDNSNVNAFILLSPCQEDHYRRGTELSNKYSVPVVALNAPFSYRYDIGGGSPYTLCYVMKRVPKGWMFRQFPKSFEAIVEGPDYEVLRS